MRPPIRKFKGLLACVSAVFFAFAFASGAVSRSWTSTGSMNHARFGHTATRLADGRVLAVGGTDCSAGPRAFKNQGDCVQFANTGK